MFKEPTGDECSASARVVADDGTVGYAVWYPQMGGYLGKAVVFPEGSGDEVGSCFEAVIWHDGEFPFVAEDGKQPATLHHCSPAQFVHFGKQVAALLKITDD